MASKLHLELALTPDGWRRDVVVGIDHGVIASVEEPGDGPAERISGVVAARPAQPAQPRLPARHGGPHRAARQRSRLLLDLARGDVPLRRAAVAGRSRGDRRLRLHGNARGGLHLGGRVPLPASPARRHGPTTTSAEMSERIVAAADAAGIGLTLLPVLYRQSGFLGKPPTPAQRRFVCDRDLYARLMETRVPGGNIGIAPHSLRAVTLDDLQWAAAHLARPAGAHPRRRTDARGRGVPGRARQAADRSAARHGRGRRTAAGASSTPPTPTPANWRASPRPMPSSGFVRSPKPISATACSMRRRSWPRAASSASARIP